jgi:hypothetical protein
MSIDAMKLALEALEEYTNVVTSGNDPNNWVTVADGGEPARKAITALRQAIKQAAPALPVAWRCFDSWVITSSEPPLYASEKQPFYIAPPPQPEQAQPFGYFRYDLRLDAWVQNREGTTGTPFYTAPPKRQPLTDEEISRLWDSHVVPVFDKNGINPIVFARAIEAAHNITGEK